MRNSLWLVIGVTVVLIIVADSLQTCVASSHWHTSCSQCQRSPMPEKCNELFGTVTFLSFDRWESWCGGADCQHHKSPKTEAIFPSAVLSLFLT